jgi:hypothetical protein
MESMNAVLTEQAEADAAQRAVNRVEARLVVAGRAKDSDDLRFLLDVLGLLDDDNDRDYR